MRFFIAWMMLACMLGSAQAVDGVSVEYGKGNSTDMARVGALWQWDKYWLAQGNWQVTGFWQATLGRWNGHSKAGGNRNITDLGLTPVFRWQQINASMISPYLEAAIGFHLISPTLINNDRRFSTAFQFGDHLGAGFYFGSSRQFDLSYRFQHLSNGSIKQPNSGINFSQIHFAYHF